MTREMVLIVGGARSGKSTLAERLAEEGRHVLFVATAEARDDEMAERIAAHRQGRPSGWDTLEEPVELAQALNNVVDGYDTILLDCLTLWVSNVVGDADEDEDDTPVMSRLRDLLGVFEKGNSRWIIVSNEVGLGVVPPSPLGRLYRDTLGRVNQVVASRADKVFWVVSGLALELKALGAWPVDPPTDGGLK